MNLKIKEPDYKELYFEAMESKRQLQARHDKQIAGYKARNTKLENEVNRLKNKQHEQPRNINIFHYPIWVN